MVHLIPHELTAGLRQENAIHNQGVEQLSAEALRQRWPTLTDFLHDFLQRAEGVQFQKAVAHLPPGAQVLDIGAGPGHTSLYLATQGYRVHVAEPALGLCELIDRAAKLYRLPVEVYNTSAEFLDRVPLRNLDACIFNASLHHCDDPVKALSHCHTLLAPGGQLLLLNEPVLQCFRSKAWFARQLQNGGVAGDYGGNEHTYYYHEYLALLRQAGFRQIRDFVSERYARPESYLNQLKQEKVSPWKGLLRTAYYRLLQAILGSGAVGRPIISTLKQLSLLQTNFIATREAATQTTARAA
jgi:SAM-dependent methyltransferase